MNTRTQRQTPRPSQRSKDEVAPTRFDPAHEISGDSPLSSEAGAALAPTLEVADSAMLPAIVVRHADDLQLHLAQRLQDVERREVELAEFRMHLRLAEQTARAWVDERDEELRLRERDLQLQTDELTTRSAAVAANEIASEREIAEQRQALDQTQKQFERREAELANREERLRSEQAAMEQALEQFQAQRRREDELLRSRRQQWETQCQGDRGQLEKMYLQLAKHRAALEERELKLTQAEQRASEPVVVTQVRTSPEVGLSQAQRQAQVARDCRMALENRWIAGQLWTRLVNSRLLDESGLTAALAEVRRDLERQYEHERETLEDLRGAITRQLGSPTHAGPSKSHAADSTRRVRRAAAAV